ncbi:hypothetical protein BKA56DRAFT_589574 [Ilyonectria sp. MPI-CAGE-AT-0026]|nr:hypothetical protein BKA56DRAFT_589574 [Ilyonectria sp. MPI-CAGE-AT-0026]
MPSICFLLPPVLYSLVYCQYCNVPKTMEQPRAFEHVPWSSPSTASLPLHLSPGSLFRRR